MQKTKFIPRMFITPLVQGIKEGRKLQTRREDGLKEANKYPEDILSIIQNNKGEWFAKFLVSDGDTEAEFIKCPYQVGNVIWIRETFIFGQEMDSDGYFKKDENGNYIDKFWYKADGDFDWYNGDSDFPAERVPWKPSIHMPKEAARLFLKITGVRAERLQDISEEDAKKEGIRSFTKDGNLHKYWYNEAGIWQDMPRTAKEAFKALWVSLYGLESWNLNPWLWVVDFELIAKPENFLK